MHDAIDATHSDDPATLTATLALGRIRAGTLTVEALASACLARVESREPTVHAWAFVDSGIVIEQARELDRRASLGRFGALHGLPIGVKDVMLTRDMPTQYNAEVYRGFHPRLDAACVATLRAAGALIFGKTETVEFAATGRPAPTRNPHDLARTPGGSSSGSAAAVADFHVPLALGTQTGGSMGGIDTEHCRRGTRRPGRDRRDDVQCHVVAVACARDQRARVAGIERYAGRADADRAALLGPALARRRRIARRAARPRARLNVSGPRECRRRLGSRRALRRDAPPHEQHTLSPRRWPGACPTR